jgi:hypothetical protein
MFPGPAPCYACVNGSLGRCKTDTVTSKMGTSQARTELLVALAPSRRAPTTFITSDPLRPRVRPYQHGSDWTDFRGMLHLRILRKSAEKNRDLVKIGHKYRVRTTRGHAVAQLVEALRYKPEGRGFEFFIDIIIQTALWRLSL